MWLVAGSNPAYIYRVGRRFKFFICNSLEGNGAAVSAIMKISLYTRRIMANYKSGAHEYTFSNESGDNGLEINLHPKL